MNAYIGKDSNIYLGKSDNYRYNDEIGQFYYDNSYDSLIFVSDNPEVYYFLCEKGYAFSQDEMVRKGTLTEADFREFARVQELLSPFEKRHEFTFGGRHFEPDSTNHHDKDKTEYDSLTGNDFTEMFEQLTMAV